DARAIVVLPAGTLDQAKIIVGAAEDAIRTGGIHKLRRRHDVVLIGRRRLAVAVEVDVETRDITTNRLARDEDSTALVELENIVEHRVAARWRDESAAQQAFAAVLVHGVVEDRRLRHGQTAGAEHDPVPDI